MNATLVLALWRQRLASPVRMAVLAMVGGMPLLVIAFMPGAQLSVLGNAQGLTLIFAAGMIGQDVSSGVLQLLLARPVRRPEYLMSRWLGVAGAAIAVSLLQILVACGLLAARGAPPTAQDAALFACARVLECAGLAAVMALLSSLVGGLGDLGIYLVANLGSNIVHMAGQVKHWTWVERIGGQLTASLSPMLDVGRLLVTSPLPWYPIVSYFATVIVCLTLATVAVNRKELSYASG